MLCTHKTTILCQFGLFCHQLTTISPSILNHFWWELYHDRRPIGQYSDKATPGILFHPTSPIHHGMVGPHVYEWKGVFESLPKGCKNQIVTAGRLLAVLDMRPSTSIKGAALTMAPSTYYTSTGTILDPTLLI